jgi:hypothetical protein
MTLRRVAYTLTFIVIIGINLAIYNDRGTNEQPGQDISTSPVVASSQPSATLASYGSWSAIEGGGDFTEMSTTGEPEFALTLPEGSRHFVISLFNDDKNMPSGSSIPIQLSFNDGSPISLVGNGSELELKANLPDAVVAQWTHSFTADETMTVSFPNSSEAPWQFQLSGTTQTITALAKGIQAAGITGLPAPWYDAQNPVPQNTVEQGSAGSTPTQPYGPQDVWTGNPYGSCSSSTNPEQCLKQAMTNGGASPQAIAFAASQNFDEWLSEFQYEGKISVGLISTFANDNPDQPVILDAQNPLIDVWSLPDPPDPSLSALKKQHPNASAIHVPMFWKEAKTENGGQAFTYQVSLQECGACGGIKYNETIVFDPQGRLVGKTVASVKYVAN